MGGGIGLGELAELASRLAGWSARVVWAGGGGALPGLGTALAATGEVVGRAARVAFGDAIGENDAVIALDWVHVETTTRDLPPGLRARRERELLVGTVVHEAAHILLSPEPAPAVRCGEEGLALRQFLVGMEDGGDHRAAPVIDPMHAMRFWFAAALLWWRARELGATCSPSELGWPPGRLPAARLVRAARCDFKRMRGLPAQAIRFAVPSRGFKRAWSRAVRRHVAEAEAAKARKDDGMKVEVVKELEARANQREAEFAATVERIAAGEKVAAPTIERVLRDANKTVADFEAALVREGVRRGWREQVEALPALRARIAELDAAIAEHDKALEEAEARHAEAVGPLMVERDAVSEAVAAATEAERKLKSGEPRPDAGGLAGGWRELDGAPR